MLPRYGIKDFHGFRGDLEDPGAPRGSQKIPSTSDLTHALLSMLFTLIGHALKSSSLLPFASTIRQEAMLLSQSNSDTPRKGV